MPNKTIPVATVLGTVNRGLATTDSTLRLVDRDGEPLSAEQAFRLGMASILEQVLHSTGNYRGFGYLPEVGITWEGDGPTIVDETRRVYACSPLVAQDVSR
jgi:hypothetical protein